jgi:membrane-bound inhibitor of C-type lysozyme
MRISLVRPDLATLRPVHAAGDASIMRRFAEAVCLLFAGLAWTGARAAEEPATGRAADAARSGPDRVVFACPGNQRLIATFRTTSAPAQAVVEPPGGPSVTLPIQLSGSGFRYADATHELRGKGRSVTWTDGAQQPIVCTAPRSPPPGAAPR